MLSSLRKEKTLTKISKRPRNIQIMTPILDVCLDWLLEQSLTDSGKRGSIFFKTCDAAKVAKLDADISKDPSNYHFPKDQDPHLVTNLIKYLLQELPDPLMTGKLYYMWMIATEKDLKYIKQCVDLLPTDNYQMFFKLLDYFHQLYTNQKDNQNKTQLSNLVSQLFLRPECNTNEEEKANKLFSIILENYPQLQDDDVEMKPNTKDTPILLEKTESGKQMHMQKILHPWPEIVVKIFQFLSMEELKSTCQVCHLWNKVGSSAKVYGVLVSLVRVRVYLESITGRSRNSSFQEQEPEVEKGIEVDKQYRKDKFPLTIPIRQFRMRKTWDLLEENISSLASKWLNQIADQIPAANTLKKKLQAPDCTMTTLGPLINKLCSLALQVSEAVDSFLQLVNIKNEIKRFMEIPDTNKETQFLKYLWNLCHRQSTVLNKESLIMETVCVTTLFYTGVIHQATGTGLRNFAVVLSKRLEHFLNYNSSKGLLHVTDEEVHKAITQKKNSNKYIELSQKIVKFNDLLSQYDSTPSPPNSAMFNSGSFNAGKSGIPISAMSNSTSPRSGKSGIPISESPHTGKSAMSNSTSPRSGKSGIPISSTSNYTSPRSGKSGIPISAMSNSTSPRSGKSGIPISESPHTGKSAMSNYTSSRNGKSANGDSEQIFSLFLPYSEIRKREKEIPQLKENIENQLLEVGRRYVLLKKKLEISKNSLQSLRESGLGLQSSSVFAIKRTILEDYAEKHRQEDPQARGSIEHYIRRLYPNLENFNNIKIDCTNQDLTGINLSSADLRGCIFDGSNLSFAPLNGANLSGVSFRGANLTLCQLGKAILVNADFQDAILTGVEDDVVSQVKQRPKQVEEQTIELILYLQNQVSGTEKLLNNDEENLNQQEVAALFEKLALTYGDNFSPNHPVYPENVKEHIRVENQIYDPKRTKKFLIELSQYTIRSDLLGLLLEATNSILENIKKLFTLRILDKSGEEKYMKIRNEMGVKFLQADCERLLLDLKNQRWRTEIKTEIKTEMTQKFLKEYTELIVSLKIDWTEESKQGDYIIDLTTLDVSKIRFNGLNLTGIKFSPDQLVRPVGIRYTTGLDPKFQATVLQMKFDLCTHLIKLGVSIIRESECFIKEGKILDILVDPLDESEIRKRLAKLTDIQVRIISFYVLTSIIINRLEQSHPFSVENLTISNIDFLELDVETAKKMIIVVFSHRKFQFNREVITYTYWDKIFRFYGAISDTMLQIADVTSIQEDLSPEDKEVIDIHLNKLIKDRKENLANEEKNISKANQKDINALISDLHKPPDPLFDEDDPKEAPTRRIREAIETASDKFVVDLRKCDFSQVSLADVQIPPNCRLYMSLDQFHKQLTQLQQQQRISNFHAIVKKGNIEDVKLWMELGIPVNAQSEDDRRYPLMCACFNDHQEIAQLLLESKADVNAKTNEYTVIEGLCRINILTEKDRKAQSEMVALLIKYGGILDLHSAAAMGDLDAVKQKVDEISRNNIKDVITLLNTKHHGESPLHLAVTFEHNEMVAYLLLYGAEPSCENKDNQTPLQIACMRGQRTMVGLFPLLKNDVNCKDAQGNSLLFLVAQKGYSALADLLIQRNAHVDIPSAVLLERIEDLVKEINGNLNKRITSDNKTILHLAAEYDKRLVVSWALKNNCNPDLTMHLNQTPLMLAAKQGHSEVIRLLLRAHNNLNHESHRQRPPLYIAINRGHKVAVKALLESNANPNAADMNLGRSCLHEATRKGVLGMVRMLIAAGANSLVVDKNGNTPLHVAAMGGNKEMVELILEALHNVKNSVGKAPRDLLPPNSPEDLESLLKGTMTTKDSNRFNNNVI